MKTVKLTVIVALLLICSIAHAQLGRMIDRSVQKTVDNKTEKPAATPADAPATTGSTGSVSATAVPLGHMTPQQAIAQCPALPTVQKLAHVEVGYDRRQDDAEIREN